MIYVDNAKGLFYLFGYLSDDAVMIAWSRSFFSATGPTALK